MKKIFLMMSIGISLLFGVDYDNNYTCGIFPSALTSYKTIKVVGSNHKVYNSASISAQIYNDNQNKLQCSVNEDDSNLQNCSRIDPPKNKYDHILLTSSDDEHYTGSNKTIHLTPTNSYDDNNIKYMTVGSYKFSGSHTTVIFDEPGDYYFDELTFTGSNSKIILPKNGIVRIFVKNNLESSGSGMNINDENTKASNLFIYVGGDFDVSGSDTELNGFVYVKGETTLPGSRFTLHGALTSEGDISIKGSKHYFYYDTNADDLGYGECPLCYDTPKVSGMNFDFGQCPGFSISMFSEIEVPIKSDENLSNVSIDEAHKKSIFSLSMFNRNEVVDQDENKVRNADQSNSGLVNVSGLGIDASLFNDRIVTYKLGDNNYNYGPTDESNYQQTYTYSLFGFDFCKWYESSLYLAHYEDEEGRHYDSIVGQCQNSSSGGGELPHGFFDAWNNDTDHGISDRNITTKIVNQNFSLIIASINKNNDAIKTKRGIDIRYALVDNDNNENNITDYEPFDASSPATTNHNFNISKAYRDVYVQFKVCSSYDGNDYTLYPYDYCKDVYDNYKECSTSTDTGPCIRKFYSSDNFAIRPDHFGISGTGINKADNNISFISMNAVDENSNRVDNYNESISNLNLSVKDANSSANIGSLDYSFNFENGVANINYLKYPEVGDINLTLSEINGSEFAKVDADDTPDSERFINSGSSGFFRVIPDHFDVTEINVSNFNEGNYTYLSKDLNMSGNLKATITAQNKVDETTTNYRAGLYAKDINISILFSPTNIQNLSKVLTEYGENNITDKNISFTIGEGNFSNGILSLNLKINFDRKVSKPVNDFNLTLNDLNVTDEDDVNGSKTIDQNIIFRYAKVTTKSVSLYTNNVVIPVLFVYYHDNNWITNNDHNKTYGDVNSTYTKDPINVTNLNEDSITNGIQDININTNISSRPYKATLHLGIASWLWYSKTGKAYKDPSASNTDCSTHPCVNIIINKAPKEWMGVSVDNSHNDVNKNTVDTNKTNHDHLNKQIYHKLNW